MKTKVNYAQLIVLLTIASLGVAVIAHMIANNVTY